MRVFDGENCNFGQNVVISPGYIIGNNVKIQNNVSVYTGVVLENDGFCGPSVVFTTIVCGVSLGRYCFIGLGQL